MEKSFKKTVSVFGIFASGLVAGYSASLLYGKSNRWHSQFRKRIGQISMPKILPIIPDFDKELLSIDVETQLVKNE